MEAVCPELVGQFHQFVETGDAHSAFLAHIEECEGCAAAVDEAFEKQASAFEQLAVALKEDTDA